MIDLSVVVVGWNTRELTLACVEAVRSACAAPGSRPLEAEIRVVDNGSTDGSVETLRERLPDVAITRLPVNRGFAAGANAGIAEARGRVLLLLNSDARIARETIDDALDWLDRTPGAGAVGVSLAHADGRPQNAIHAFPGLLRELVPRWLRERACARRFPSKRGVGRRPVEVEAVLGAALFVRREVVDRIGGLDEGYFFFLEETDWCWRMRRAGFSVWHVPTRPVVHLSGASSKRVAPAATRIEYHRSLYRFVGRHRGPAARAGVAAIRVLRAFGTLVLLTPLAPFSARQRGRMGERWAVLRWHARGCPASGGLSEVAGGRAAR